MKKILVLSLLAFTLGFAQTKITGTTLTRKADTTSYNLNSVIRDAFPTTTISVALVDSGKNYRTGDTIVAQYGALTLLVTACATTDSLVATVSVISYGTTVAVGSKTNMTTSRTAFRDTGSNHLAANNAHVTTTVTAGKYFIVFPMGTPAGVITHAMVLRDTARATNDTTMLVLLSDTTGLSNGVPADNVEFSYKKTYNSVFVGEIQLVASPSTTVSATTGARGVTSGLSIPYTCKAGSKNLYGILVNKNVGQTKQGVGSYYLINLWKQ